jgi:uncharacterized membrane protein
MANTSLGMNENVEGALCYLVGWLTGIVFYLLEKDNEFVRFHARQSILTFLPLSILSFIFSWIPFLGWIIGGLIWLITIILWLVLMIKAYQGHKFKVPVVGDIAERGF